MDVQKIITDCETLENTITVLIKDNALKESQIASLQLEVFEYTKIHLNDLTEKETQLQGRLDEIVAKRQELENNIKQYTSINEKLSDLVSIAQKRCSQDINDESIVIVSDVNEDYLQVMSSFDKAQVKLLNLEEGVTSDTIQIQSLIKENSKILVDLHKNDNLERLYEQQNKYAEQQFDLVLNQLPWEPLTKQNIADLLNSPSNVVKDLAGVIQIQAGEIEELNESVRCKKQKKCEVLDSLLTELSSFIHKRGEAVLIAKLSD